MGGVKKVKKKVGRPTVMTSETLGKLESGFKIGLTDTECCLYADINPDTLYEYQKKHPEFTEKKEMWKRNPIAKAKNTIYKNLDDPAVAKWLLERRDEDFSTKIKQDINTNQPAITLKIDKAEIKEAVNDINNLADE